MIYGLDEIDRKMLEVLQENGRITVLELADKVGLSPTPCGRRLRSLEERGFIERYVALLRPESLGLGFNCFVQVRLNSSDRQHVNNFIKAIKAMDEVQEAYFIAGDYDYLLHIRSESAETFKSFLIDHILSLPVVQTQTYIILEQAKHTTAFPLRSLQGS
jgi:Lrp/AsnC family transcriptional regulator, leucine-responsive regulatory protein